jgi:hypothetical protein
MVGGGFRMSRPSRDFWLAFFHVRFWACAAVEQEICSFIFGAAFAIGFFAVTPSQSVCERENRLLFSCGALKSVCEIARFFRQNHRHSCANRKIACLCSRRALKSVCELENLQYILGETSKKGLFGEIKGRKSSSHPGNWMKV